MLLANRPAAPAGHCLEQLAPNPELQRALRHKHVAGAPSEVLADADLLPVDADQAVGGDLPADPLLPAAFGAWRGRSSAGLGDLEPARRGRIAQRLVGALGVVVGHPL